MTTIDNKRFKDKYEEKMISAYGKTIKQATNYEKYVALSETIMDIIQKNWMETKDRNKEGRNAHYFSAEFLIGRSMGNNLLNLGILDDVKEILKDMDIDYDELEDEEEDAALGNGGLGRLAACFMESSASLAKPLQGYGVRYSEGIFKQRFENGFQFEESDNWAQRGDFWSVRRESEAYIVTFRDFQVRAVPYDVPIVGYKNGVVNNLRLWQSEALDGGFNLQDFNNFKYDEALSEKNRAEDITRVLYPNDVQKAGKVLRLAQQYFFVSASVQDLLKKYQEEYPNDKRFKDFPKYHIIQLNDTHPVIAIPELIRILMDDHGLLWDEAWDITKETFAFTNHTVLPEAMERWSFDIIDEVSSRCKDIMIEIDRRMVEDFKKNGMKYEDIKRFRIVEDNQINMAWLACYVSTKINGVAEIHTSILKRDTLYNWDKLYPGKIINKTNGVTPRRWLQYSNPELAKFITKNLGSEDWTHDLSLLKDLEKFINDKEVLKELNDIKHINKVKLAKYIKKTEGVEIDPDSIFDIQIKRLHEYKRQLLNALHILYLYNQLKNNEDFDMVPRTFIFGAKAAPGYFRAKGIIKFINEIANLVNNDEQTNDKLKVVFIQNYRVSSAEKLFPACDVSEQISTAGKEASGTGNMKFMMNGSPTLGTFDGANVEIFREAGEENNFVFGARVEELEEIAGSYNPKEIYENNSDVKEAIDYLINGKLSDNGTYMFQDIYRELTGIYDRGDQYYLLKDFDSYKDTQKEINDSYKDREKWAQKCLMNIANSGKFSSDRTILEYCNEIWDI